VPGIIAQGFAALLQASGKDPFTLCVFLCHPRSRHTSNLPPPEYDTDALTAELRDQSNEG